MDTIISRADEMLSFIAINKIHSYPFNTSPHPYIPPTHIHNHPYIITNLTPFIQSPPPISKNVLNFSPYSIGLLSTILYAETYWMKSLIS